MTFRRFALNNVLRNKRLYVAYFLSSMFTVMVFFTFANFAFHPVLSGDDLNGKAQKGMAVAGGIIYVFSFFFILYSMSSFLQSRKKEFGLLMIQGMSNRQIRWMVFLENMLIGLFATISGILLGLGLSKVILLIAENLLELEGSLNFYFPTLALIVTFFSFIVLFFFISLFVTFILRTKKLVKLIKGDKIGKPEPKASIVLTLLAILLLGAGYATSLYVKGAQVVIALVPVVIVVTIGTYLFFTQLSVYVIRKLKSKQGLFWRKTNMLLFSDLSHRMKDNARAFFMVAIISTVAFSAIGTLVGLNSFLTEGLKKANPYTFTYYPMEDEDDAEVTAHIEDLIEEHDLEVNKTNAELTYFEQNGQLRLVTTTDVYNDFAALKDGEQINIGADEIAGIGPSDANLMSTEKGWEKQPITLENGEKVYPDKDLQDKFDPNVVYDMYPSYIVGEEIFNQLPYPDNVDQYYAWQVTEGSEEDIIALGEKLTEEYPTFMGIDAAVYDIHKIWSPVMFVGLFIGIVFFVSAGSFLYFRLYTDLDEDREKFAAISKIGLTSREMSRVISKQIALLFFAPIVVALVHGAVALTALSHMFDFSLIRDASIVLGSFLIIQIIYFIIVRYFYVKQVKQFVHR